MAIPRGRLPQRPSKAHVKATLDAYSLLYGFTNEHQYPGKGQVEIALPRENLAVSKVPRGTRAAAKPKPRKEWREQEDIYKWTQMNQSLRGHVMMIGNDAKRNVVQAAVSRRMGLLAGASDLFIAKPVGQYAGLWLEVKQAREYTKSQKSTDHWKRQQEFQDRMRKAGYAADFAFGAEHGIMIIGKYLGIV